MTQKGVPPGVDPAPADPGPVPRPPLRPPPRPSVKKTLDKDLNKLVRIEEATQQAGRRLTGLGIGVTVEKDTRIRADP